MSLVRGIFAILICVWILNNLSNVKYFVLSDKLQGNKKHLGLKPSCLQLAIKMIFWISILKSDCATGNVSSDLWWDFFHTTGTLNMKWYVWSSKWLSVCATVYNKVYFNHTYLAATRQRKLLGGRLVSNNGDAALFQCRQCRFTFTICVFCCKFMASIKPGCKEAGETTMSFSKQFAFACWCQKNSVGINCASCERCITWCRGNSVVWQ